MEAIGFIFAIAWYVVGFWGLMIARRKGHMRWIGGIGFFTFFLYGWAVALIIVLLPLALGPIMWAIAKYVMADRRTPATWAPARPQ